jgi:hypothetical protein
MQTLPSTVVFLPTTAWVFAWTYEHSNATNPKHVIQPRVPSESEWKSDVISRSNGHFGCMSTARVDCCKLGLLLYKAMEMFVPPERPPLTSQGYGAMQQHARCIYHLQVGWIQLGHTLLFFWIIFMTRRLADFQSLIAKKRMQVFFVINKITAESLFLFLPVFVNITEPLSCQGNTVHNDTVLADKCGYLPRSTNTDDGPDTKLEPLLKLRKKTRFLSSPLGLEKETTCCKINGRRDCSNFGVLRSE